MSSRGKVDAAEGFLREELAKSEEPAKAHVTLIAYLRETKGDDAALAEVFRVLKPGGRLAVSDIALKQALPEAIAREVAAWTGCIAGAMTIDGY